VTRSSSLEAARLPRPRRSVLGLGALVFALACSEGDSVVAAPGEASSQPSESPLGANVDVLPSQYPNRLSDTATHVDVVLTARPAQRLEQLGLLTAWASAGYGADGPRVAASAPVVLSEAADGGIEATATFAVAELRSLGLLGPDTTRLSISVAAGERRVLGGRDRLFDTSAWLLQLSAPSGPSAVGTSCAWLTDASRAGDHSQGRRIGLRAWYPALATDAQPADYFLEEREASLNATGNGLPADLFDRVHGTSRLDAPVDASQTRPVLVMSTGWASPIALYASLAEDLASHGYVVLGLAHPDGSGVVVYPDGSDSGFDAETPSSDAAVEAWAEDVSFVADWLSGGEGELAAPELASWGTLLGALDRNRVGAIAHSLGGAAVVRAAVETSSIRASANIDGSFRGPILERGPTTPVLTMLFDGHSLIDPSPAVFRENGARAAVYEAEVRGSGHNDFTDYGAIVHELAALDSSLVLADFLVGSIGTDRALSIESAYVRAFFGAELSATPSPLMQTSVAEYPEVSFAAYPALAE
jgi:dienelactone hydrolase